MRIPLSWVREYAPIDDATDPADVARRLTAAGLEVESAERAGHDISGVVVAQVTEIEELAGFKKPIRFCRLTAGDSESHGVICGAANFSAGDRVPLALPGAELPGGFRIEAKPAYGRLSAGMICSASELAIGDDRGGILVLPADAPLGADFVTYAGLRDVVLDIAVTPDRGYATSVRGVARELASAFGVPFTDPAGPAVPEDVSPDIYPASIADPAACDRFVLRELRGLNPAAGTPLWMRVRLARSGMRSVSLAVDVTNYLLLELGQPLHAFDRAKLNGPIVVRRAEPGERLETLDHTVRVLDPDDILITDSSGPISMAGTMGGLATEIGPDSTDLVIEAAHFSPEGTARMSRRHKLSSETSYRFERGVDRELPLRASAKAVSMLASFGGASVLPGCTHAWAEVEPVTIALPVSYPDEVAGVVYGRDTVVRRLREVGCEVRQTVGAGGAAAAGPAHTDGRHLRHEHGRHDRSAEELLVIPPSWRPDLTDPSDLAEEVIRLEGYANIPVRMPRAVAGHGLTVRQRMRRTVGRALAGSGYVEVLSSPFGSAADADSLQLPPEDTRRVAVTIANPLSEDEPLLRTTLLPGLLRVLGRNAGRGFADVALYETGLVFHPRPGGDGVAPILRVDRAPTVEELGRLHAALPDQPLRVAVVLAGNREPAGWWGSRGRPADWADAVEAAREVCRACRVPVEIRAAQLAPWHPGRCAGVFVRAGEGHEWLAGHAGELHPRVVRAFGLPDRTCAMEIDLSVIETAAGAVGSVRPPRLSGYPVATQDVALTVPDSVPAASVQEALTAGVAAAGAGELLEDVRLFDLYTGEQTGAGRKSLAYTLRFRAPDRTLTVEETTSLRDAAVAEAARQVGAVLRGG
ncbi:MAG TPA: phenylalanine--tRNA ligase subunit beta [Streptosporangiaceae bacterium]|nr:phenylalanine--tRNA ligase subunit beta [Streptosporangiaceae bacterium]